MEGIGAARKLTLFLLASIRDDLGLGLAGGLLLRHDVGSGRCARQPARRLDRSVKA